jgi:hypothetical protein
MRVQRRFVLCSIFAALIAATVALFAVQAQAVRPADKKPSDSPLSLARADVDPTGRPGGRFVVEGVGSCAAAACHGRLLGGLDAGASELQSAVARWTRDDPHARASLTLNGERSRMMLANLRGLPSAKDVHPDREELCLKCHAMSVQKELQGPKFDATDGVGCEMCHGPAGKWKPVHDLPSWQLLTDAEKAAYGMRNLKNPVVRADVCAGCHQGSPEREVNHDLIGAGHPALFFDVSAQMDRMPHHWSPAIDRCQPDFSARLWVSGQLMGVRTSMENLEARAGDTKKPWPEFAEYDCLSCHRSPLLNPLPAVKGVRPGQTPYMAWGQPMTRHLAAGGRFADPELKPLLDKLADEMNKPLPSQDEVKKLAGQVKGQIDKMLGKLPQAAFARSDLRALMQSIASDYSREPAVRWYTGVQVTSALTALHRALSELDPAAKKDIAAALKKLQDRFPPPVDAGWRKQPTIPTSLAPLLNPVLDSLK